MICPYSQWGLPQMVASQLARFLAEQTSRTTWRFQNARPEERFFLGAGEVHVVFLFRNLWKFTDVQRFLYINSQLFTSFAQWLTV
jgi:hypothetical protein